MKNSITLVISGILIVIATSCEEKPGKKKEETTEQAAKTYVTAPAFNEDSAYYYTEKQVAFGPRVPNTYAHELCGDYLIAQLNKANCKVNVQQFKATTFDGKSLDLRNIIASINPQAQKRIILAAHWDTRPFADQDSIDQKKPIDGANDGASGVGILLEVAKAINASGKLPQVGIDIILFDGEDYGAPSFFTGESANSYCLGSQYWAKNNPSPAYYGILLDMAGSENAHFAMEGTSRMYAPAVIKEVWDMANHLGYSQYFIYTDSPPITDDHAYVNDLAKIPMIDIIDYNVNGGGGYFGHYWHTHNDNMKIISKNTLKAVGETLLNVLYNER